MNNNRPPVSGSVLPLILLGWRNLWRNRKRTGIMLAAITVGVWAMILMTALMRGMVEDMLVRGIDQLPGHIQIHHPAYLDDPSVVNSIPEPDDELQRLLSTPEVINWYSRVKVPAVIASERDSRGIVLQGIDPLAERETIFSNLEISEGRFLESEDDAGIVIGEKLARRLETRVGKRVVLMSQDPENNLAEKGVRVVGLFDAELPSQEEAFLFIGRQTLQKLLDIEGQVSEVAIFGEDYRRIDPLYAKIAAGTDGSAERLSVKPWYDINSYLGSMMSVMDGFVLVWVIVIFLALSFGLANTLVMAVFERVREIGLMLALGMRPGLILGQILIESAFLLLIGLILGNSLAILGVYAVADGIDISGVAAGMEMAGAGAILYPHLLLKDVITANLVVIVLGLLTSALPAWQASHYDPIRALTKPT